MIGRYSLVCGTDLPFFVRRDAVVEGYCYGGTPDSACEICLWAIDNGQMVVYHPRASGIGGLLIAVTGKGDRLVIPGDWVVLQGGRLRVLSPRAFEAVFEVLAVPG